MPETQLKLQLLLDFIMVPLSIFMVYDYSMLILSGEDSLRRKIVLAVWVLAVIGWSIKLLSDLKKRKSGENRD